MSIEIHVRHETEGATKKFAEAYAQQCAEQIVEKFSKVDNVHVVTDHQRRNMPRICVQRLIPRQPA
jgi:capsular polysaccharide biosynthesis protein